MRVEAVDTDEDYRRNHGEVTLRGAPICPGIGVGPVHWVDVGLAVTPDEIDPPQVATEQQRYTDAVETTKSRLRDHLIK